jgi:hypothetical protein
MLFKIFRSFTSFTAPFPPIKNTYHLPVESLKKECIRDVKILHEINENIKKINTDMNVNFIANNLNLAIMVGILAFGKINIF